MKRSLMVVTVLLAAGACVAQAAPERVLTIAPEPNRRAWTDYYYVEGGGTQIERAHGGIPIVEHQGKRALKIHITPAAGGYWQVGIAKRGWGHFQLDDFGRDGTLEFDLWGELPPGAEVQLGDADRDGPGPDGEVVPSVPLDGRVPRGQGWRRVAVPLGAFLDEEPRLDLMDLLKIVLSGQAPPVETTFYVAELGFHTTEPEKVYPPVKVNQVGYRPGWEKVAKVTPSEPLAGGMAFLVRDAGTGAAVFEGELTLAVLNDAPSGDDVYEADFSAVEAPGTYVVEVPQVGESVPFAIAQDVYDRFFYDATRFYFFQRCGMELTEEHAGPYAHRACHVFDEAIPEPGTGQLRDGRGGWHDAGDMNRYTSWTRPTVWRLLMAYRDYPDKFPDGQLDIPESGNGVPDLLDEVRYEIEWVRKMLIREGPDAGRAYERVHESGVQQPPDVDFFDRRHRLVPPTDEGSCAVVSNCALAYLVYREFPSQQAFAEACLQDALLAWAYLASRGKPDEKALFTAAAVLFEATGREDAHDVVKRLAPAIMGIWHGQMVWDNYDCGVITYVLSERPEADEALRGRLRDHFLGYVDASLAAAKARGYDSPMMSGVVFVWGSNGRIAKIGTHMLVANRLRPREDYVAAARDCLHWLLGRNPVDTCMITGYGTPPLGDIYHSMYGELGPGLPMPPGYLCGGPSHSDAPHLSANPAKCWRPAHTSFELTECSIGYQAPLVYLTGALAALGQ
jgi:endoglucanase